MSDLISRQALCEYALNQKDKSITPNDIMRFPSAQPDLPIKEKCAFCPHCNNCDVNDDLSIQPCMDTISRQAAIKMCREPRMRNADCSDFEMEIMMLPSAQPDSKESSVT